METESKLHEAIAKHERERAELRQQLKAIQVQLRIVDHKIHSLKEAANILKGASPILGTMSLCDATEEILKAEGHPLHRKQILDKVKSYSLFPTIQTLDSVLRKDIRNRFFASGRGMFGLNPPSKSLPSSTERKRPLKGLTAAIRNALREIGANEFSMPDVLTVIEKQNPKIASRLNENNASLSATLNTMARNSELEVVRNGYGSLPNIYIVKALRVDEEE